MGIPKLYWTGIEGDYNIIVIELLGKNLGQLFKDRMHAFTKKTALSLLEQMVECLCNLATTSTIYPLQKLHSQGYKA